MLAPPSELGGVKVSVACALPAVAVVKVGAPGAVATGVGVPGPEVPPAFVPPPPPQLASSAKPKMLATLDVISAPATFDRERAPSSHDSAWRAASQLLCIGTLAIICSLFRLSRRVPE
jgi:hypothetical protein